MQSLSMIKLSHPVHMGNMNKGQRNQPYGSSYPICMPGNVLYSHRGNDKNKPKCSHAGLPLSAAHTHSTLPPTCTPLCHHVTLL